jgi:hypothetical protein
MLNMSKRKASIFEKLFSTGLGTNISPAIIVLENVGESLQLSLNDVMIAWGI